VAKGPCTGAFIVLCLPIFRVGRQRIRTSALLRIFLGSKENQHYTVKKDSSFPILFLQCIAEIYEINNLAGYTVVNKKNKHLLLTVLEREKVTLDYVFCTRPIERVKECQYLWNSRPSVLMCTTSETAWDYQ
jgi:hypothetical protein